MKNAEHDPHRSFLFGQKCFPESIRIKKEGEGNREDLCQPSQPFKTPIGNGDVVVSGQTKFLTVKELAARYGLSQAAIYGFIKTDPAFPYANVGLRKKFLIEVGQFEAWLTKRTEIEKREHFSIPTAVDLAAAFRNRAGENK